MNSFLIQSSIYISNIFSPEFLFLISVFFLFLSVIYLNIKKIKFRQVFSINCPDNIKGLIIILSSIIISVLVTQIIKFIFKIPRPINMLIDEVGYSFPSGHTATAFGICFAGIYLIYKYINTKNYIYSFSLILIAIFVSISRLVLQVHRPVDIVVGMLIGASSAFLSVKIYYNTIRYVDHKNHK